MTLQEGGWGIVEGKPFRSPDQLWSNLGHARAHRCNLLANIGPRADGSLPEEAVALLRETGRRLKAHGWPEGGEAARYDAQAAAV